MKERGFIHAVRTIPAGSLFIQGSGIGDTVLYVEDAVDFDEDGGTLAIDGNEYNYASADMDNNTITLAEPLQAAVLEGEQVFLLPYVEEFQALVLIGDSDETLTARIPHGLNHLLPEGVREEGGREGVEVEQEEDDDEWYISDVYGKAAIVDGMAVDVTTLPPVPSVDKTPDGFPPDSSPTPIVKGGLGMLFVTYSDITNHDFVTYKVYVSDTSPVATVEANLVIETGATIVAITSLPDGSPLVAGTTYYVVVVASDADGDAAPGGEGSAAPVQGVDPQDLIDLENALNQLETDLGTANTELDALDAEIETIGQSANGKNKVFHQASAPTATADGDVWFDSDDGNRIYRWHAGGSAGAPEDVTLDNPGFEGTTVEAQAVTTTSNQASVTADTAIFRSGLKSWKWNPALPSNGTATVKPKEPAQATTYIPSAPGTHTFKVWLRTNLVQGDHTLTLRLRAYDGSGTLLNEQNMVASGSVPVTTSWQEFTVTQTAITNTAFIQPVVDLVLTTDLNNASFYIDDMSLVFESAPVSAGWVDVRDEGIDQAVADASTALTAANGKNKITYSTSAASGTTGFIAGDTWFQRATVDGVITGQWEFDGSAWVAKTVGNQVIANLDAGKITAGFLDAARINANTITSTMITDGAVSSTKIEGGAITTSHITVSGIDAGVITAGTMSGERILANSMNASKIVAGSITTDRMTANTINGDRIATNTLNADRIVANSITSDKLNANAITTNLLTANNVLANAIDVISLVGVDITGATVQTTATAARGIKLDGSTNSFAAYNSSGTQMVHISGTTGVATFESVTVRGIVETSATGNRVVVRDNGSGTGEVRFFSGVGGETYGFVRASSNTLMLRSHAWSGYSTAQLDLDSGSLNTGMALRADSISVGNTGGSTTINSSATTIHGSLNMTDGLIQGVETVSSNSSLTLSFSGGLLQVQGNANFAGKIVAPNASCSVVWQGSTIVAAAGSYVAAAPTAANTVVLWCTRVQAFNTYVNNSDYRNKQNIEPLTNGIDTMKRVNMKSFEMKHDPGVTEYGIIAQELETVLPSLVSENDDGVKFVSYNGLWAVNAQATKELIEKNEALEARVKELETWMNR